MDHYQKEADFLNSIKWHGEPIFKVSAESKVSPNDECVFPIFTMITYLVNELLNQFLCEQ